MDNPALLAISSSSHSAEPHSEQLDSASQKPEWIPEHIPELDGLRGIAIISVFFYHARGRLVLTWIDLVARWGWTGVSLFFVLSGYLITSILLRSRDSRHHYFRNFYARRALRVWPVYYMMIGVCFSGPRWLLSLPLGISKWKAIVPVLFFLQNIVPMQISEFGALGPTWSLAIEEQYYMLWAPIIRLVRPKVFLALGLLSIFLISPILRRRLSNFVKPTHTLLHLDCIVLGSLLALALWGIRISRKRWFYIGIITATAGFSCLATCARGTIYADSLLAVGFSGVVLLAISGTGSKIFFLRILRSALLRFYGRISYGFYMTHIGIFMCLGFLYERIDRSEFAGTIGANLSIVAIQFILSTLTAALVWYGIESRVLKLKRYF